jgi:geranylgeranylglycerol-phosphate geranylgeranyltransferase
VEKSSIIRWDPFTSNVDSAIDLGKMTVMTAGRALAYIQMMRPVNGLMQAFAVSIGFVVVEQSIMISSSLVLGIFTAVFTTGASMVANDYWDRDVDAINVPTRPIPSGRVTPRQAVIFTVILSLVGLSTAFATNFACLGIALISLGVALAYSWKGKDTGLPGNLMVSLCVAIPFIYGGVIPKGVSTSLIELGVIGAFAFMAFLANTGREITKGIADMAGDQLRETRTIAIQFGVSVAAKVSAVFYIIPVIISLIVWVFGILSEFYLPIVVLADLGFFWSALSLIHNYSETNATRIKNRVLLSMFLGLIAFVIGGINHV